MRSDVIVEVLVVGEGSVGAGDGELAAAVDLHGQQGAWVCGPWRHARAAFLGPSAEHGSIADGDGHYRSGEA